MGEALITRRGGGITRGTIHNTTKETLTIPDLIGAKNAMIGLQYNGGNYQNPPSAVFIRIENGSLVSVMAQLSSNLIIDRISKCSFDAATGTISSSSTDFVMFDLSKYSAAYYDYVVW